MASGVLMIDMGLALGKHEVKYVIEHTGRGHVSFLIDVPFVAKIKKGEPTCREFKIAPGIDVKHKLGELKVFFERYQQLLAAKRTLPVFIPDKPTFELAKIKDICSDFKFSVFSHFFNARASIDLCEAQKLFDELETALDVEKARSGVLW